MRTHAGHPVHRGGFTLVELLVVIGIIVVLVTLLIAIVARVRNAAYAANTQQELNSISSAIQQYYGVFHAYPGPFSNDQLEQQWPDVVNPPQQIPLEWCAIQDTTANPQVMTYSGLNNYITSMNVTYNANYTVTGAHQFVTGAENLALGLLGGLRRDPTTGYPALFLAPLIGTTFDASNITNNNFYAADTTMGLGPMNLNPADPRRYSGFLSPGNGTSSLLTPAPPTSTVIVGGNQYNYPMCATGRVAIYNLPICDDTIIPEFYDRFPTPKPILYLRARTGAPGILSGPVYPGLEVMTTAATPTYAYNQYDLHDILAYTQGYANGRPYPPYLGSDQGLTGVGTFANQGAVLPRPAAGTADTAGDPDNPSISQIKSGKLLPWTDPDPTLSPPLPAAPKVPNHNFENAGNYFQNPTSPHLTSLGNDATSQNAWNYTGKPRAADQYILISAGPDGIYGTPDDITSFGSVGP